MKKKTSISLAVLIFVALVVWWLLHDDSKPAAAAAAPERVARELEIVDDVYSPYFGMTPDEVAAEKAKANPAIDPVMRQKIDESNEAIAGYFTIDPSDLEAP